MQREEGGKGDGEGKPEALCGADWPSPCGLKKLHLMLDAKSVAPI